MILAQLHKVISKYHLGTQIHKKTILNKEELTIVQVK